MEKERIIQEFVPGKQVTLAHLIAHPGSDLAKKIGVPGAEAIGIMTLTPGETAMIAGDLATKAAGVDIPLIGCRLWPKTVSLSGRHQDQGC